VTGPSGPRGPVGYSSGLPYFLNYGIDTDVPGYYALTVDPSPEGYTGTSVLNINDTSINHVYNFISEPFGVPTTIGEGNWMMSQWVNVSQPPSGFNILYTSIYIRHIDTTETLIGTNLDTSGQPLILYGGTMQNTFGVSVLSTVNALATDRLVIRQNYSSGFITGDAVQLSAFYGGQYLSQTITTIAVPGAMGGTGPTGPQGATGPGILNPMTVNLDANRFEVLNATKLQLVDPNGPVTGDLTFIPIDGYYYASSQYGLAAKGAVFVQPGSTGPDMGYYVVPGDSTTRGFYYDTAAYKMMWNTPIYYSNQQGSGTMLADPTRIPDIVSSAPQLLLSQTQTKNEFPISSSSGRIDNGSAAAGTLLLTDPDSQRLWRVHVSMRLQLSSSNVPLELHFQLYNIEDEQTCSFTIFGSDEHPYGVQANTNGNASFSFSDTLTVLTTRQSISAYLMVSVVSLGGNYTLSAGRYSVTMEPLFSA
jgi:hypothetical protein